MIKIGAVNSGGTSYYDKKWDYQGRHNITQIFISHGGGIITGIQFQFAEKNGQLVLSELHGSMAPPQFYTVKLNYPSEYITWVSGYSSSGYSSSNKTNGISSLEIGTNKGKYGPFGVARKDDERFELRLGEKRQFDGFYGSNNDSRLITIGVYLKPVSTLSELNQVVDQVKSEK